MYSISDTPLGVVKSSDKKDCGLWNAQRDVINGLVEWLGELMVHDHLRHSLTEHAQNVCPAETLRRCVLTMQFLMARSRAS